MTIEQKGLQSTDLRNKEKHKLNIVKHKLYIVKHKLKTMKDDRSLSTSSKKEHEKHKGRKNKCQSLNKETQNNV